MQEGVGLLLEFSHLLVYDNRKYVKDVSHEKFTGNPKGNR